MGFGEGLHGRRVQLCDKSTERCAGGLGRYGVLLGDKKKNAGPFVVQERWSITGRNFLASFDSFCLLLLFAPRVQGRGLN